MKFLFVCLAFLLALGPSVGLAADGAGNGKAYGHDNGNNGNAQGHANGGNIPPAGDMVFSPQGLVTVAPDQNQALDALGSGALPLSDIADRAVARWGGRVIDAKLIHRDDALVYRLTMLSDQGVSRRVLYDARTGAALGDR